MPNTGLQGPLPLTRDAINAYVPSKIGAYALGYVKDGRFYVQRVGRSDNNVNGRLQDYLGRYSAFKFEIYDSVGAAFLKECQLYHDFNPAHNDIHPDSPNALTLICPCADALAAVHVGR